MRGMLKLELLALPPETISNKLCRACILAHKLEWFGSMLTQFIFLLCLPTICQKLEAALHFYFRGISVLYQNSYIWYLVLKVVV